MNEYWFNEGKKDAEAGNTCMENTGIPEELYIDYLSGYNGDDENIPRQYSLVYFDHDSFPSTFDTSSYPFMRKTAYLFLGEIPNMPGHCVVVGDHGKIIAGYHTEEFVEIPPEDMDDFAPARR